MPTVRRALIPLMLISVLLAGQAMPIVNAAYVTLYEVTYSQELQADANGHTYLYMPGNHPGFMDMQGIVHDKRMDITHYAYNDDEWLQQSFPSIYGVGESRAPLSLHHTPSFGWLGNSTMMPSFADFANNTNDYSLSINDKHIYFGLPIGQEISLILEPGEAHFGSFNATTEEFFHLTAASRQDQCNIAIQIQDSSGRSLNWRFLTDGDVQVIPFAPDGPGTYFVSIFPTSDTKGLTILDLFLQGITPEEILPGSIIEDVLQGSELIVENEAGDIVHQEKAPTAHTYKFSSNSTHPGRLRYSVNHPELDDDVYDPFPTKVEVTTDSTYISNHDRYLMNLNTNGDTFYYQSFQSEVYYLTVMGMENTEYILVNDIPDIPQLPLNTPYFLQSHYVAGERFAFTLPLASDSLIKVNTTDTSSFNWFAYRTFENGVFRSAFLAAYDSFHNAQPVYLPAGNYLIVGTAFDTGYEAATTFTLGPVIDGAGAVAANNEDLIGLRIPVDAKTFYKFNITLETHDNVSVKADCDLINEYGTLVTGWAPELGNIQSGISWVAYGVNRSSFVTGRPSGYNMFCDGDAILAISPYEVRNNTGFTLSNYFRDYTVDYSVTYEDDFLNFLNGTETPIITSSPQWVNFTLGDPGDSTEWYMIDMTCEAGTWFNVTCLTADVDSLDNVFIYQRFKGCAQRLEYSDLSSTMSGLIPRVQFQFGIISDEVSIFLLIDRTLAGEGSLNVSITPYYTNTYQYPPDPMYIETSTGGGIPLPIDSLTIAVGVGVVVAVVMVVAVVVKKRSAA